MAQTIRIWGESDDVVELDGDLGYQELYPETDVVHFTFGDGTKLEIRFTADAEWRVTLLEQGTAAFHKDEAYSEAVSEFSEHSDLGTLTGELQWVRIDELQD